MAPKHQKTAAEKRATRGPNSVWSRYGSMKAARTDRWYKWTDSLLPSPIQEFIAAHNIPQEEVLSVLSAHYENDVPRLHPEGILDTSNQGASGSYFGHGQSSSRPINLGSLFAMPFLLSQPCFLSIWTKPLPWAPVFFVRSNPLSFHNSQLASLSIRTKLHSWLFRHATTLPMTGELR